MRKLVLWGHHWDEYQDMFALTEADTKKRVLEYGCAASAVNAKLSQLSGRMVSCDPLFALDKATLSTKVSLIFEDTVLRLTRDQAQFDFSRYGSLDALVRYRREGVAEFFADYEAGKAENRYVSVQDYHLPFSDFEFDLAVSAHYLFADLDDQDIDYHVQVLQELARVAKEVRVFPLVDRYGQTSPFLGPVLLGLQQNGYGIEVREVAYHLQEKGNAMLRIWAQHCSVG